MADLVPHERLLQLLDYNPETGVFTNKERRANCCVVGAAAGSINSKGYRVIKLGQRAYKAHRLAIFYVTGAWPPDQVDHINGVKDDNRYANLRPADQFINQQNKHGPVAGSASGLLGAHRGGWKGRRWVAEIRRNGVRLYLGVFRTPEEAHAAYMKAKAA